MSRRRSAGGVFWGLALVALGGVLLARNLGYEIPIWSGIARYWPVLIILWGLLKLVDYYRFRNDAERRALFSAGEIALLVLVIFAGSAITVAANISPQLRDLFQYGDIDLWDVTGNNYEYTEHHEMDAPAGAVIEVVNRYGNINITPNDADRIVVDVNKTVRAVNREDADRLSQEFGFSIRQEGGLYRIVSNFDRDQALSQGRRFRTSLTIRAPSRSLLRVENRNGRVHVERLAGNQTIRNAQGEVVIREINGALDVENRYGNVRVEAVTGGLNLQNRNGRVEIADVGGDAKIDNGYAGVVARGVGGSLTVENRNGRVEISEVKGSATVSNSYGAIIAADVQGELKISGRNNGVEVHRVAGDVSVESSFQNIQVRDVKGAIRVNNRNGDVRISLAEPPVRDISVSSEFSNVRFELPARSSFLIEGRTRFGQIESEFDALNVTSDGPARSVSGRTGAGGPRIRIDTRNGNIRIASVE